MSFFRTILGILILTYLSKPGAAQQYIFKNYTVNDGLVANSIRRIFQDSKGFLWIATWEGLSKYDGHKFTNYSTANGLSHNMTNDFYESKDGRLYAATNDGSIDMITENNTIQKMVPSSAAVVNRFLYSPRHKVIVTTDDNGLQEFSDGKLIKPRQPFPLYKYSDLIWLNDSLFMTAADSSIQVFTKKYELYAEMKMPYPAFVECKIYMDSKKRVWAGTYAGLKLLSLPTEKNKPLTFSSVPASFDIPALQLKKINDIFEGANGITWIGTTEGLVKINPDDSYQLITAKHGLASDNITSIFQDNEKNIWFGTASGLSKLVTKSNIRIYNTENGLWSNYLSFLYPVKKGYLLAGTDKGVQIFNTTTGKFTPVANSINRIFYSIVPNTHPLSLFHGNKIISFDTAALQYREKDSFYFGRQSFYNCISNKRGNFFLGGHYHLYFFPGSQIHFESILDHRVASLLIDKKEYLWAGTWDKGLYRIRYAVDNNKIKILATDHYLPGESIRSLFEDSKGNIWVGTQYHGVYRLSDNGKGGLAILNLNQTKGLTSDWVKGTAEDGSGNIWIAFYQGLDKLIKQDTSYRIFNFSRTNNFFPTLPTIASMITDKDHSLWLATAEGIVQIMDGKMETLHPLPVYITKISSPDSTYPVNTDGLNLNYKHNQLQFEFSSPGFINERQVLYSYRLSGSSNAEWTKPDNQHAVSYANLQPGSYRFEVRNKGWNGEWGNITSFEFVIFPPFWQTWWFISVCAIFLAAVIYWLVRKRIAFIRREAEMKNKITETEMMALRAQMNPHFIFNCLNSIDNLIQNGEKEKATMYLAKFAKLLRAILENSKKNTLPCWKDLETLKLYLELEEFRCDKKFSYQLNIASEILQGDYKVPPMVIQPYVENAILHGLLNKDTGSRKLAINVTAENNRINYVVQDNGIGRKKAAEYKQLNKPTYQSMGLDITRDRINLFNQSSNGSVTITDLYNENKEATGTKVEVHLLNQS